MTFKIVEQSGNQVIYSQIENLDDITRRSIRQGFFKLAKDLKQTTSKDILRKPKSGRVYIIRGPSGRRRRHIASAPGETHANMTGALRRSLGWKVTGAEKMEFGYGVDKPAPKYGIYLEDGTRRMKPRPSLRNNINKINRNAEMYFNDEFNKAMK